MSDTSGVIYAAEIMGDGYGRLLHGAEISKVIKDDALAWVHLDANNPASREWLQSEITYLDSIIIDALLAEETRPRIVEFESGALLILRGVNLNENARTEDMVSIRIWVDAHRIISIQRRSLKAIRDIQEKLEQGKGPKGSADFVSTLAGRLFERMEPIFADLTDQLDDIEERVMEEPDKEERGEIIDIRKKAIIFKRYVSPQKDIIAHLRASEIPWMSSLHKRQLQESLDRLTRYVEDLDAIRERSQIIKDELSNALADKMNKNMYVLSVIAAIFLPLGFLTGLFGINVGGMPGVENGAAFWIVCAVCVGFTVGIAALFKYLKWY